MTATSARAKKACLLESGDRLSRPEFHRRYEASGIARAELIEGVVYVSSPVRGEYHRAPDSLLATWLGVYCAGHPETETAINSTVLLDLDNELQPDSCLWRIGGQSRFDEYGYIEGAPELVVEIAASSVSIDLNSKKTAYRRNGVKEYIVWRVLDDALDWFVLEGGEYVRLQPDDTGVIESREFPGLRLALEKLIARDRAGMLAEIRPE